MERSPLDPHLTPSELTPEEIELLESIFSTELPKSPIDIEACRQICQGNEDLETTFQDMLTHCLRYTEDVAAMEKHVREHPTEYDEDREMVDRKRTITHNATISAINIFARTMHKNGHQTNWLKWDSSNRAGYGNFAILVTLNRFRDNLLIQTFIHTVEQSGGQIDYDLLKQGASAVELKIIEYVEILAKELESDVAEGSEQRSEEKEVEHINNHSGQLSAISSQLGKSEVDILAAFHEMYLKRYHK